MKKKHLKTTILVYENIEELPTADQLLLRRAKKALKNAYVPYSAFQVGAAALLQNGKIIIGSNQENAAYPVCLCAERAALAAAANRHPRTPS